MGIGDERLAEQATGSGATLPDDVRAALRRLLTAILVADFGSSHQEDVVDPPEHEGECVDFLKGMGPRRI